MENKTDNFSKLREFVKKNPVPEAYEALEYIESLKYELEAYAVDMRAYCKSTGRVWKHRIDNTKSLLEKHGK